MTSYRTLWLSSALGVLAAVALHWAGTRWPAAVRFPGTRPLIRATHYTADVSAPDFWSRASVPQAARDFQEIRKAGFNTVILIASWTGFQPRVDANSHSDEHYRLLDGLMAAAGTEGLDVLLRVGYAHDISNTPDRPHHDRTTGLLRDPATHAAWLAYLRDLEAVASTHPNFRYAFLSWEDFFFLDYTHAPEEERLKISERLGYSGFLRKLPAAEYRSLYGGEAREGREHPIPAYNTLPIAAFSRFWDEWLLELLAKSRAVMPDLNMEVRTDCDPVPAPKYYACHERTYDLGGTPNATTIVYYTPAWGAENHGDLASAARASERFRYMLAKIRQHTDNPIFIDQFNFVDNTPGFEHNTRIDPAQMSEFLQQAGGIIAGETTGYALWTMWDVTANIAANGEFERGLDGWKTTGATLMNSVGNGKYVHLSPGGTLSYFVREGGRAGVPIRADLQFTLRFRTRDNPQPRFRVEVFDPQNQRTFVKEHVAPDGANGEVELSGLPYFGGRETLRITNEGGAVTVDGILLFNRRQENGIFTTDGKPKAFTDEILALNEQLAAGSEPREAYTAELAQSPYVKGVSEDGWVGKRATFWLAHGTGQLVLEAYVPETWTGYAAGLHASVDHAATLGATLRPGLNRIPLPAPAKFPALVTLECGATTRAARYDAANTDTRPLCFVLKRLGTANAAH